MRATTGLCFVFTLLSCVIASPRSKRCSDCIDYESCWAARDLVRKADPASDDKLRSAFCGYDQKAGLPKVCCSELSAVDPTNRLSGDGIEGHPNLRLLPENCGEVDLDKIVGGKIAGLYEYPWMVLLSYKRRSGLRFDCGGSLINEQYVLTAAHCVVNQPLAGVRIGEHDIETDTDCEGVPPERFCESNIQDIRVQKTIPHPDFVSNKQRDIALLRLKKKVNLSYRNARVVCLPVTQELQSRDIVGLNATVTGWGLTETGYKSSKLLAVDVPIAGSENCALLFNRRGSSDENYKICAGRVGQDSCGGDSGGPLMLRGFYKQTQRLVEYGIVSTGPVECGSGETGTYTNVAKHMRWILDNIEP